MEPHRTHCCEALASVRPTNDGALPGRLGGASYDLRLVARRDCPISRNFIDPTSSTWTVDPPTPGRVEWAPRAGQVRLLGIDRGSGSSEDEHRSHSVPFKRQVVEEDLAGETLHGLAKRHDLCHNDRPIFPARTKELAVDGPNQLWVADLTYVAIAIGFVYVAVILDAWSRRVVGYAIARAIDARLTIAALRVAIEGRKPPPGCIHHSDRGSQYAASAYCELLARHGLIGSMGRRGNPVRQRQGREFHKNA